MQKNLKELTTEDLRAYRMQVEKHISEYKNIQVAKKVQLNSAYGALG